MYKNIYFVSVCCSYEHQLNAKKYRTFFFYFFFLDFLKFLLIEQLKYKYCPFLIL